MRPGTEAPPDIHTAVDMPGAWMTIGAGLLVLGVLLPLVVLVLRRLLALRAKARAPRVLEQLRAEHLGRVDRIVARWRDQDVAPAEAVRAASAEARGFLGTVLDRDVDFMTLSEIERMAPTEPRLKETVALVRRAYAVSFATDGADSRDDDGVEELLAGFREVISGWS